MMKILMTGIIILIASSVSFAGVCGDVNADGKLNLLDISYIINNLYRGGPDPNCGPETGTATDIDGNIYHTIKIGDQWWMVENLKVTRYRNGEAIPNVTDVATWAGLTTGAYCEYNNDLSSVATYGRLYNGYSVGDGRNLAPDGWHIPTDAEWKQLEMHLGMNQAQADSADYRGTTEGGKLKESGTTHWLSPNTGASNESGFSGLPGGCRSYVGYYVTLGGRGHFWSSTEYDSETLWYRGLPYEYSSIIRSYAYKLYGFSVRCVKD